MIDQIPLATRRTVRDEVFQALRQYATHETDTIIEMAQVFSDVAGTLEAKKVVPPVFVYGDTYSRVPRAIGQLIRQTVWELCLQGVLTPSPRYRGRDLEHWFDLNQYALTPYGIQVLTASADQIQVHDPEGYLSVFRATTPPPDDEMMRYLGECVEVFRHHHLLATVVLLGAASERLLEVLALYLRGALGADGAQWFTKYTRKQKVTDKFDLIDGTLRLRFGDKLDNRDLVTIKVSFEHIREIRNDVVHQHNYRPSWNEIAGLLHNFVLHFKCVHRILAVLLANPIT